VRRETEELNMATTANVPITIAPEAAAHVADLGLQREFEQMLEHAKQTVPGLRAINVILTYDPETGDDPRVIIEAMIPEPARPEEDTTQSDYTRWEINTFPPAVLIHFCLMTGYEAPNGR
jgi:hypothetical protein